MDNENDIKCSGLDKEKCKPPCVYVSGEKRRYCRKKRSNTKKKSVEKKQPEIRKSKKSKVLKKKVKHGIDKKEEVKDDDKKDEVKDDDKKDDEIDSSELQTCNKVFPESCNSDRDFTNICFDFMSNLEKGSSRIRISGFCTIALEINTRLFSRSERCENLFKERVSIPISISTCFARTSCFLLGI